MKITRLMGSAFLIASTTAAVGCGAGAAPDGTSATVEPAPVETTQSLDGPQKLIHSVTVESNHTIGFYELPYGQTLVAETMLPTQSSAFEKAVGAKSMSEIFKAVAPGTEVPAAITEADARRVAVAKTEVKEVAAPPAEEFKDATGPGPSLYNAGEQAAFKAAWCHDTGTTSLDSCVQGFSWANIGWKYGGFFQSHTTLGSEAAQSGTYNLYCWNGSQYLCWNGLVSPGSTLNVWNPGNGFNSGVWVYNKSEIINAGTNTTVSLVATDCGNPGQRSCGQSCGGGQACTSAATDCVIDGTTNGTCVTY